MKARFFILVFIIVFGSCGHTDPGVVNADNARRGEKLFNTVGCLMCHSVSGETKYGPSLKLSPDSELTVIRSGSIAKLKPDRQYIIRSLKQPDFEKVNGYQSKKMPSINLSNDDIEYLADYLIYINRSGN
jgi:cytochrome c oxidase subunit 2